MVDCLITKKEFGETIREYVIKLNILNSDYRIQRKGENLVIPIIRKPTSTELAQLQKVDIELLVKEMYGLLPSKTILNSHLEILKKNFTEDEFALAPRSFDTIGDIVIVEIPDELAEKKIQIGEAFLQAYSSIKSVFAKTGKVEGVNRIRPVEFLAGEKRTKTIYKEHGVRLAVDIEQAYFSPRLSLEHNRIANKVNDIEVVVDLFCGIGPFAIPIAKKSSAKVYAIDINPQAIELLRENISLNKLKGEIISYIGDCRQVVEQQKLMNIADRTIMNLPGYAIQFIDVACKVIKPEGGIVHFFEFVGSDNPEETIINDLSLEIKKYNRQIKEVLEVRKVRMSAPRQWQMVADVFIK